MVNPVESSKGLINYCLSLFVPTKLHTLSYRRLDKGILDPLVGKGASAETRGETGCPGRHQRKFGRKRKDSPTPSVGPLTRGSEAASSREGKAATLESLPQAGHRGTDGCARRLCPQRTFRQPDLPRGLMVFSVPSFSLEPPLDMSAAMEKALAREESCGLGDAVNSMAPSVRSWPRTGPAELPSSLPQGRQKPTHSANFPSAISAEPGTPDESAPTSQELHTGLCPSPQSPPAPETSN